MPCNVEVPVFVVVRKVVVASHPDIAGNEDPDGVVHLSRFEVVVQEEEHLQGPYVSDLVQEHPQPGQPCPASACCS